MTSTERPFCSANWKIFGSSASAGAQWLAATSSAAKHALENAIKPAATVLVDCRGIRGFGGSGMICCRAARHLLSVCFCRLQALGFRIAVQRRAFVGIGRTEEQPVGEAVIRRFHGFQIRGELLADRMVRIGSAGIGEDCSLFRTEIAWQL